MSWVAVGVGVVGAGVGIYQTASANKRAKKAGKQIPFETSEEAYDVNQLAQHLAQNGFDAGTLSYFTNQIGRNTSDAAFNTVRTGGTPNQVAEVYDQGLEATFRVGAENSKLQYENFNRYINSLLNLDENAGAEWASRENNRKDQLAAAEAQKQAGMQSIVGGISNAAGAYAGYQQANLYNDSISELAKSLQGSKYPSIQQDVGYRTNNYRFMNDADYFNTRNQFLLDANPPN